MSNQSIEAHKSKNIITKDEFFELNEKSAREMSEDKVLRDNALNVLVKAD